MPKSILGGAPPPDPAEGAYSAPPDPVAKIRGPTSNRRGEREGEVRQGEGRRVEGRGMEWNGGDPHVYLYIT